MSVALLPLVVGERWEVGNYGGRAPRFFPPGRDALKYLWLKLREATRVGVSKHFKAWPLATRSDSAYLNRMGLEIRKFSEKVHLG